MKFAYLLFILSLGQAARAASTEFFQYDTCKEKTEAGFIEYEIYIESFPASPLFRTTAYIQKSTHDGDKMRRVLIYPAKLEMSLWAGLTYVRFESSDGTKSTMAIQNVTANTDLIHHNGGEFIPLECVGPGA